MHTVGLMVKVLSASGTTPKVGFTIKHGPEAGVLITQTTMAAAVVPAENLFVFDCGNGILGEWIQGIPVAEGTATGDAVLIEVYEMRKPF